MHSAVVDLFQLLVQAGAVPGQDFSFDAEQQACHLNERCYELLQAAFPDVDWPSILGDPYAELSEQIAVLHHQLGTDFISNIVNCIMRRLPLLPDDTAAGYVQAILVGVESATGIALFPFLHEALDLSGQVRLEWLLRQEQVMVPGDDCLQDLLQSVGAIAGDYVVQSGEFWLTEAGWQRLSLVWDVECQLSQYLHLQKLPRPL